MADRSFKIHDILTFYQCFLTIPSSKHQNIQISKSDVKATSKIANIQIYVKQAIKQMKDFCILKNEIPINIVPLIDGILKLMFYFWKETKYNTIVYIKIRC